MADGGERTYGATVAKRRLSRRLAAMRERAGLRPTEVDDRLAWKRGKLARIERNEWILPNHSYIRDLLRTYEASTNEEAEIMDLVERASVRPWWRKYAQPRDEARVFSNEFPGFENDAARISVYTPLVIPGLLQAPPYARALMSAGTKSSQWKERALEARLRRQQILGRTDGTAPRLDAVVTEASLLYRWGMHDDRREQIEHLAEMSRRRTIELRIQRFDDGPPTGIYSMVNIFDFPDDEPPLVFVENDYAVEEVSKEESVRGYIQSFERAADAALEPADTTVYLDKLTKRME